MRFQHSSIFSTLFVFTFVFHVCGRPLHILLVVVDDFGWSDVGFHGSKINTPNMDKLAAEGVILDNCYVQPICTPTRSALLSGRYPIHTGLQHHNIETDKPYGLPLNITTLPQALKNAGYATHMVGKWHLIHPDFMPRSAQNVILSHNASLPLFLYLPFQNVHGPMEAPEEYVDKYHFIVDMRRRTYAAMVDIVCSKRGE
ncbi:hypothetical protein ACROYT_G035336 [Oculina patagonica]